MNIDHMQTPLGLITIGATENGLAYIGFGKTKSKQGPELTQIKDQLEEYFQGARKHFDLDIDLSLASTLFRREVIKHLETIPYGKVHTYSQVAHDLKNAGAIRAIGTACAKNPIPIVLPCHRVVRSDGSLGEYAGGAWMKKQLLTLEGAL